MVRGSTSSRRLRKVVAAVCLTLGVLLVGREFLLADPPNTQTTGDPPQTGIADQPVQDATDSKVDKSIATKSADASKAIPSEVADWIEKLSSKSFRERQTAVKRLISLGGKAIPALKDVGLGKRIEAALRAVSILRAIYISAQQGDVIDAAESALLMLKQKGNGSVARRAAAILVGSYPIRQARAVKQIRKLGGQVQFGDDPFFLVENLDRPEEGFVYAVAVDKNWKGTQEDFEHIGRIDSLVVLYLIKGHAISDKTLTRIQQQLPDLKVQTRGRSFLGVGTRPDELGCKIGEVKPGSAAREGGLLTDDIVVEIAGKAVASPDDLIRIIGEQEPGSRLKIVVLRCGDPIIKMTLAEFRHQPETFQPLLAVGLMNEVRREVWVTLKAWNIDN